MAFLAGFWLAGFFGMEAMGCMAAVAFGLDIVAPFAERLFKWVGRSLVLTVFPHPIPGNGMPAHLKLFISFRMTLSAYLGLHRRLFRPGFLMTLVAGDTVHTRLGMFAVYPGLKNSSGVFLMAGQTVPDLFLRPQRHWGIDEEKETERKGPLFKHMNLLDAKNRAFELGSFISSVFQKTPLAFQPPPGCQSGPTASLPIHAHGYKPG